MKAKNIILVGAGGIVGFVSCSVLTTKKILENDKMRNAVKQIIYDKVGWILYGEIPQSKNRSRVSYYQYYNHSSYDRMNVFFNSREDAENVLNEMKNVINSYGVVTVEDFYDLSEVDSSNYTDRKYGWTNLDKCKVVSIKGKDHMYKIDLPNAALVF